MKRILRHLIMATLWLFVSTSFILAEEGLVGYWSFDEGQGDLAYDYSGTGNHGTIFGATWVDGKIGKALQFDGIDDFVNVPDSPSLDLTKEMTIMAWIKILGEKPLFYYTIVGKAFPEFIPQHHAYTLRYIYVSRFDFASSRYLPEYGKEFGNHWHADYTLLRDVWYFVALTYDSSAPEMRERAKLYGDGGFVPWNSGCPYDHLYYP